MCKYVQRPFLSDLSEEVRELVGEASFKHLKHCAFGDQHFQGPVVCRNYIIDIMSRCAES